jgi:hypothetical protein
MTLDAIALRLYEARWTSRVASMNVIRELLNHVAMCTGFNKPSFVVKLTEVVDF